MTVAEKEAPVEPIEYPGWLRSEEEDFDIRQLRQEMAELKLTLQKEPALQGDYSVSIAQQRLDLEAKGELEDKETAREMTHRFIPIWLIILFLSGGGLLLLLRVL